MPDFLEEFASSIGNKKEALKEKILKGKTNPVQDGRFTVSRPTFSTAWRALDAMIVLFLVERKVQEQGSSEPLYGVKISLEQ